MYAMTINSNTHTVPTPPSGYKTYSGGTTVKGFILGDYTYWPYDDVNNMSDLIIVAYDSNGVEQRRFSYSGRYTSSIIIDNINQTVQLTLQSNTLTLNWSDLKLN